MRNTEEYAWLSDHTLVTWTAQFPLHVKRIDIGTHEEKPLVDLDPVLQGLRDNGGAPGPYSGPYSVRFLPSPDQKSLLGLEFKLVGPPTTWANVPLDGSPGIEGAFLWGSTIYPALGVWLPDSRHWLNVTEDGRHTGIRIFSLDRPNKPQIVLLPALPPHYNALDAFPHGGAPALLGRTAEGNLLVMTGSKEKPTDFVCSELRYTSDPDIVRNTTIHVPNGVRVESVLLSPDAEHLAWIWRRGSGFPVKRLEVWISRVDGEEMHSLGFIDCRSTNQSWTLLCMSFSWIPDGKRLSFCFKGGLYAVPAN